jgi:hypothetical protein
MFVDKSKVKNIQIVAYLRSSGIEEKSIKGSEYCYLSPITNERSPSFFVNVKENVFYDYSSGAKGDIINLVMAIHGCTFVDALQRLEAGNFDRPLSFSCIENRTLEKRKKLLINKIIPLTNSSLVKYVRSREISMGIARKWLNEIHYTNAGKPFYALGFKNDSGGYELRNGLGFKGKTANGITTINKGTSTINLFEGFFDFLSALQFYGATEPSKTTVILNTTVNVKIFTSTFDSRYKLNCYLDNDKSGVKTFDGLVSSGYQAVNKSTQLYIDFKDFNDFITKSDYATGG